mmetsp:Transcript_25350/g.38427  ORF Transcript_25350/g.38427 Transcript_25350/m.38427 type:complete len:98 (+) Transcript_25350:1954-2247(+)
MAALLMMSSRACQLKEILPSLGLYHCRWICMMVAIISKDASNISCNYSFFSKKSRYIPLSFLETPEKPLEPSGELLHSVFSVLGLCVLIATGIILKV